MNFLFAYKMAIKSILGNKVRSLLTMLGVIIGVMAVIVAVGFAQGSMATITNRIEGMGSNAITGMIVSTKESSKGVTTSDLEKLANSSAYINSISPYTMTSAIVKAEGKSKSTGIIGTNEDYLEIEGQKLKSGRFITRLDLENSDKVAVIGAAVEKKLFEGVDPLGKTIKVKGVNFTIVGTLESVMNAAEGTKDDYVFIPVNVAQRTLKIKNITMFIAEASSQDTVDLAKQKIDDYLYSVYKDKDDYILFTQESILSMLGDVSSIMMLILGSIATISLVVGGIGIMNIMLVSVTERTREIGIRKAIGAKKKDILVQFLIEALMLTGIGGIIGIILGLITIKYGIGSISLITPVYSLSWTLAAFLISLTIGVVFGIFPAYKAAKLNPIDALRTQ